MTDLYMDPATGDLALEQDDLVLVDDIREVAQECVIRLRMFLGEWFADETEGLIDREKWFAKAPNMATIRDAIRREMLKVNGVISISSPIFEIDGTTRSTTITIDGLANDGPFQITVAS